MDRYSDRCSIVFRKAASLVKVRGCALVTTIFSSVDCSSAMSPIDCSSAKHARDNLHVNNQRVRFLATSSLDRFSRGLLLLFVPLSHAKINDDAFGLRSPNQYCVDSNTVNGTLLCLYSLFWVQRWSLTTSRLTGTTTWPVTGEGLVGTWTGPHWDFSVPSSTEINSMARPCRLGVVPEACHDMPHT